MLEDFKLKVFLKVSELGSFTTAAKSLGISQPAVSQTISELEKFAGDKLFDRSCKGNLQLTEKGRVFKSFAEKISKNYEDLNAVFNDYEAFVSFIKMSEEIKSNPLYEGLKDIFFN